MAITGTSGRRHLRLRSGVYLLAPVAVAYFALIAPGARPSHAATFTPMAKGDIIASLANGNVVEVTPTGTTVQTLISGARLPTGSAFDGSGNLYVTEFQGSDILKVDGSSGAVSVFTNDNILGDGTAFNSPESIAFGPNYTKMYVSDANRFGQGGGIHVIDTATGKGDSFFPLPSSQGSEGVGESDWLAFNRLGSLFMTNENASQGVMRVDLTTGNIVQPSFVGNLNSTPYAIAFDPADNMWLSQSDSVVEYDATGKVVRPILSSQFSLIFAAVFNPPFNTVYAGDLNTGSVFAFDLKGNSTGTFNLGSGIDGLAVVGTVLAPPGAVQVANSAQEPVIAVNPTNSANMVMAYNHATNGVLKCGVSTSFDGGKTWTASPDLAVPSGLPKTAQSSGGGDPALAFTPSGRLYAACLTVGDDGTQTGTKILDLFTAISTDGGRSFNPSTSIQHGTIASQAVIGPDEEALAASPTSADVYVCYAFDLETPGMATSGVRLMRLDASGGDAGMRSLTAGTHERGDYGCSASVGATGRVWAGWWNRGLDPAQVDRAEVAYSDNAAGSGNMDFSPPYVVGQKRGSLGNAGGYRWTDKHVLVRAGKVGSANAALASWEDDPGSGAENLMLATFGSGAWSNAQSSGAEAYQPAVDVGADGQVAIGYYHDLSATGDGSVLLYTAVHGKTIGSGLGTPLALATGGSSVLVGLSPFHRFGDYTSVVEVAGIAYCVWTDNAAGSQSVWFGHA